MKIVDNFASKYLIRELRGTITGAGFPWFGSSVTRYSTSEEDTKQNFLHSHIMLNGEKTNTVCDTTHQLFDELLQPLIQKNEQLDMIRCWWSPPTVKRVKSAWHKDREDKHTVGIIYLNDNNSYTEFRNNTRVRSVSNRLLLFSGENEHRVVSNTAPQVDRITINFHLLERV